MPTQDRRLPADDDAGKPIELSYAAGVTVVVERGEPSAGLEGVGGEVGLAQKLLAR
jgi:hypothetical protein